MPDIIDPRRHDAVLFDLGAVVTAEGGASDSAVALIRQLHEIGAGTAVFSARHDSWDTSTAAGIGSSMPSRKCRLRLSHSSREPKPGYGRRCHFRRQLLLIRCYQSCHFPRPTFIVRCLLSRSMVTSGNCLERNTFGDCKKTPC